MPDWTRHVRPRLSSLRLSPTRENDIIEELSQHLDDRWREVRSGGASEDEATRLTLAEFQDGNALARYLAPLKQATTPASVTPGTPTGLALGDLWQDLRYATRALRKQRAFTWASTLTLALGIGATAALFSIVDAVLLRPLPFREPDRLARLTSLHADGAPGGISYPDFLDWQTRSHAFERMAVYSSTDFALRGSEGVSKVRGVVASADLFTVLGVSVSLGRPFVAADYTSGAPMAVVLSDSMWRQRFGADPSLVGRTIELDHKPALVVGVMPAGFEFPIETERAEFWTSIATGQGSLASQRGVHYLDGIARLARGASFDQAQAELAAIVSALNRQYPENEPRGVRVDSELSQLVANVRSQWLVLFGAAGCLFLLACVSVVNMLLARAASRRPELAVRFALGARRERIVRQLLTEHTLLGALGASLGLAFAWWCIALLKQLAPPDVPRLAGAGLNTSVLAFTTTASFAAVVLFGLLPALHASTQDPTRVWNLAARGRNDEVGGRVRRVLVTAQIAIAMVLLTGGTLLLRTLVELRRVDGGYSPAHVVTFRVDLPDEYAPAREQTFYSDLLERLSAMPGVRAASAGYDVPLSGRGLVTGIEIEGRTATSGTHDRARLNSIQPGFFPALGVRLVTGRDFAAHDGLDSNPVAIVNEAFVRRFFDGTNPVGRHVKPGIGNGYRDGAPLREIVGVVQDVRASDLKTPPEPEVFVPGAQCPSIGNSIVVVRTDFDAQDFAREARRVVASVDASVPVSRVRTLEQYIASAMVQPRFSSFLLGLFAVLSTVLAITGLYGLISYTVAERTREIGIRLALGSARQGIFGLVLRQGAFLALAGIGIGLVATCGLSTWMASLLYGVGPRDPVTFAGVACLLFCVTIAACAAPAARAIRIDPNAALRQE
jgi:predicted permease